MRIIYTVCALKGGGIRGQKSLCLVGMYTIDTDNPWSEGLPFLTLHTLPPFYIIFIVIIWKQNRKGQKSRETERKAHCGHWPMPGAEEWMGWGTKTGWRLAETHPKDWVTVSVFQWQRMELLWTGTRVLLGNFPEKRKAWGEKRKDNLAGLRANMLETKKPNHVLWLNLLRLYRN